MDKSSDFSFSFRIWIDKIVNHSLWRTVNKTLRLKNDFQKTFSTPEGIRVLHYLSHFCRANHSCWSELEREQCFLEGRRDVFLEIMNWCQVSEETLLMHRCEGFDEELEIMKKQELEEGS